MRRLALVAALLFASACSAGSDGSSNPVPPIPVTESLPSTASAPPDVVVNSTPMMPVTTTLEQQTGKNVVTRAPGAEDGGVVPEGVASVMARVTSPEGESCEVCLWLAEDDASRQRGLMGVTDLGDAIGMAFRWDQPRSGNFFMFQTPTPLSIAWFDAAGAHVGQADMEPCLVEDSAVCERYTADSPYVLAVEMFGGQLDAIGIDLGSSIELLDLPCA